MTAPRIQIVHDDDCTYAAAYVNGKNVAYGEYANVIDALLTAIGVETIEVTGDPAKYDLATRSLTA